MAVDGTAVVVAALAPEFDTAEGDAAVEVLAIQRPVWVAAALGYTPDAAVALTAAEVAEAEQATN